MGIIALFIFVYTLSGKVDASVALNEFTVLPTQTVEIVNTSSHSADISGWHIDDSGGSTFITLAPNTVIAPYSCVVITGSINLNTTSADTIRLFDNTHPPTTSSATIIDQYFYVKPPPSFVSIGRIPDGSGAWTEHSPTLGMWNETGVSCLMPTTTPTPTPNTPPTPTITPLPEPTPIPTLQPEVNGIYIEELYPYPNPQEKEWVKIKNTNSYSVELINWYIDDAKDEGSAPKPFSATILPNSSYTVILTSPLLNNDGDIVRLLDHNKNEKDAFEFDSASQGVTINKNSATEDIHESQPTTYQLPTLYYQPVTVSSTTHYEEPKRAITYQPPLFNYREQNIPRILGTSSFKENGGIQDNAQRLRALLIIPLVNSALTIISLFIKMNHA